LFQIHVGGNNYAHAYVFIPLPKDGDQPVLKGFKTGKDKDGDIDTNELRNSANTVVVLGPATPTPPGLANPSSVASQTPKPLPKVPMTGGISPRKVTDEDQAIADQVSSDTYQSIRLKNPQY
jgi:hypothetical protein